MASDINQLSIGLQGELKASSALLVHKTRFAP
jgi:hypothetical protein